MLYRSCRNKKQNCFVQFRKSPRKIKMHNREVEVKEKVMSRLKAQKENKVKNENESQVVGHLFSFWINKDSGESCNAAKDWPPISSPGGTWTSGPVVLLVSLAELEGKCEWSSGCSVYVVLDHHTDGVACFSFYFKEFLES